MKNRRSYVRTELEIENNIKISIQRKTEGEHVLEIDGCAQKKLLWLCAIRKLLEESELPSFQFLTPETQTECARFP
uniref:Uncharacterized protein n=1 Tax=Rhizophora mucronata TaxID=61149 RepID=A0A2P2LRL8_RHIMU